MEARESQITRKTLLPAVVYFDQRKQSINCIIRELSAQGATLICDSASAVPINIFELYIPSRGEYFPAAVKERRGSQLHVSFVQADPVHNSAAPEGEKPDVSRRLQLLETEVAKLRRIVDDLRDRSLREEYTGI